MSKVFKSLAYLMLFAALLGCSKEERSNYIPYIKVDFRFYPYTTDSELSTYGGIKKFLNVGYNKNGVYVCQFSMTDEPEFMAFDATCPLEQETGFKASLTQDPSGILKLKCPKCKTVFDLRNEGRGGGTWLTRYPIRPLGYKTYYQVYN